MVTSTDLTIYPWLIPMHRFSHEFHKLNPIFISELLWKYFFLDFTFHDQNDEIRIGYLQFTDFFSNVLVSFTITSSYITEWIFELLCIVLKLCTYNTTCQNNSFKFTSTFYMFSKLAKDKHQVTDKSWIKVKCWLFTYVISMLFLPIYPWWCLFFAL